jgi:hypothetical protein
MERMKINSKTRYNRARIRNGHGPHRILHMLQEEIRRNASKSKDSVEVKL